MQSLSVRPQGLKTYPNQISKAPPGSMVLAKNAVLDRDDVVEMRRGMKQYGTQLSFIAGEKVAKFYEFAGTLLANYKTKMAFDSDGAGTWSDYSGSFSPPSGALAMRSAQANKNFYLATSTGIKKLETPSSAFTTAGMVRALDGQASTTGSGWMTNNTQAAYRIVWGIKDANTNLVLGAPSQRIVVVNASGGATNVSLSFGIPAGITTSHFFQVYRSAMSSGVAVVPTDELGLVYEASPTAGQIAALAVTLTDITPENLRGATLYTSPSQQGALQENGEPPLARDMVNFKGYQFFFDTISKHRYFFTLISVGGTGLVNDDTITIGGVVYTAKASEAAASGQFKASTGGTPADNIEATALSLVRVINTYASNTGLYAYYISGYNDLPGRIMLEERSIGGAGFVLISSRGNAFNPFLPTSGTTQASSNAVEHNAVRISKSLQPEAVPTTNVFYMGSADKKTLRAIALRDSIFVFREDGIFRIVGSSVADFTGTPFDTTVKLLSDETAVAFNNQAFGFTNQGIVAVSETGVAVMSRDKEGDFFELSALANFQAQSFAIAYESARKYIFFTITNAADAFATQAFVFNVFTRAWTGPWVFNASAGIVKQADDKLYLGIWAQTGDYPRYVRQERKAFTVNDYADEEFAITIVSSSGAAVVVASSTNIRVKDKIKQGSRVGIVTAVTDGTHIVVDRSAAWVAGAAVTYRPIDVDVEFVPDSFQNPGVLKQTTEAKLIMEKAEFRSLSIGFSSDISGGHEFVNGSSHSQYPFGQGQFGPIPWGGGIPSPQPIRTWVPRRKQRGSWLSLRIQHQEALSRFAFSGVSYEYEPMSSRMH